MIPERNTDNVGKMEPFASVRTLKKIRRDRIWCTSGGGVGHGRSVVMHPGVQLEKAECWPAEEIG